MRIVSAAALLALGAVLLVGRAHGFDPRDLAETPTAPDGAPDADGEDAFVVPQATSLPEAGPAQSGAVERDGDVPRGRLFVSEIFRPPA